MMAGDGEVKSNIVMCIIRWFWNWLFKKQGREESAAVTQNVHGLKTDGTNSPNIIAAGDVTVNIGTTHEPQKETVLKQVWHNPTSDAGGIMPRRAESIETIRPQQKGRRDDFS